MNWCRVGREAGKQCWATRGPPQAGRGLSGCTGLQRAFSAFSGEWGFFCQNEERRGVLGGALVHRQCSRVLKSHYVGMSVVNKGSLSDNICISY